MSQNENLAPLPGFFLAGIMAVHVISGIVIISGDTDFQKQKNGGQ